MTKDKLTEAMAWKLLQQDHPLALQVVLQDILPWSSRFNMPFYKSGVVKVTACVFAITEAAQHLLHG